MVDLGHPGEALFVAPASQATFQWSSLLSRTGRGGTCRAWCHQACHDPCPWSSRW
jgi:hypothetical protein